MLSGILNGICFSASNTNPDELKDDNTEVLKNVQTYEDCQRRCESDLTCKKWTHIERSSLCNKFKTNVVDKQELDGCTSGAFKEPVIQGKLLHVKMDLDIRLLSMRNSFLKSIHISEHLFVVCD